MGNSLNQETDASRVYSADVSRDHTFVVCAYKESKYLSECLSSLVNQTVKSSIILVTSTPCEYISSTAEKYGVPVIVNEGIHGISGDWNFGLEMVKTRYATIAHQDDFYEPEYTEYTLAAMKRRNDSIIAFTDYGELRNGVKTDYNKLLKVKRLMLWPLGIGIGDRKFFAGSKWVRRRILSMGNPVSCPSVMYDLDNVKRPLFIVGMKSNIDWEAWEILSRNKGSFIYVKKRLTYHRIHVESTTSELIADNGRTEEDLLMFRKFWPKSIASLIMRWYSEGQKSNNLDK